MAFIDFAQPLAGPTHAIGSATRVTAQFATPEFTPQEWQIVALARADGLRSLRGPGRLNWLRHLFFGSQPTLRLADTRLEALRLLAVEAWHKGYAVSLSALDRFRAAGFSAAQLELLLGAISVGRHAKP